MAREGVALNVIQRQLGHADLGITSVYLQVIDSGEIVDVVHGRRAPVAPATTALWRVGGRTHAKAAADQGP
jgi:integrase/recombinase XerD